MFDFQKRVIKEKEELLFKLDDLTTFIGGPIYPQLDDAEKVRLKTQSEIMREYIEILSQRINAFS